MNSIKKIIKNSIKPKIANDIWFNIEYNIKKDDIKSNIWYFVLGRIGWNSINDVKITLQTKLFIESQIKANS